MPSTRRLRLLPLVMAAASVTAAGCSTPGAEKAAPNSAPEVARSVAAAPEGPIALSPAGVTTKIDVPAQSTEEQYAQSCLATKEWMAAQGGDPDALVEPYLKIAQSSDQPGPATFGKLWPQLSTAEQAAVIIAVRAAADGGC